MSLLDWKQDQQIRNTEPSDTLQYTALVIHLPISTEEPTGLNEWSPVNNLSLQNDERLFISGFVAGLQLSKSQRFALLKEYANVWNRAYQRERSPNRKAYQGRFCANSWLRNGAKGFVQRQLE